ncbi:MAG: hypothetical protein IKD44_13230 [Lentisphaeria bacterium]|nr:hypothetical protein [Lentisphaeria bacterium]
MKKNLFAAALLLLGSISYCAAAEETAELFLYKVRNFRSTGTYSRLNGQIQHRRRGKSVENTSIYFGVIIQNERFTGHLVIGDKDSFLLSQARKTGVSAVTRLKGNTAALDHIGLRATDLTLGFLHGKLIKELPRESLSMAPCRVMLLESTDKKEEVKVWISSDHYFPLKAEFFRKGEKSPYRTLECNGFTKRNDLYYARYINLEGPGWRTRVAFDPDSAELGFFDSRNPVNIMRQLPADKK